MADSDGDGLNDAVDPYPNDPNNGQKPAPAGTAPAAPSKIPPPRTGSGTFTDDGSAATGGTVSLPSKDTASTVFTGTSAYAGGDGRFGSPRPNAVRRPNMDSAWDDTSSSHLSAADRVWITGLAKAQGGRSGSALWQKALDASQNAAKEGRQISPYEILRQMAAQVGYGAQAQQQDGSGPDAAGGGSRGGGGSGGPSTSVSYDNAAAFDVRAIADGVAQEMLGRVVSDDEMKRILKRVRTYENRNPSVSNGQSGGGMSVSRSSGGATTAGRQEIVKRVLAKNPDLVPFQMDHTVLDTMLGVMKQGQEIANG